VRARGHSYVATARAPIADAAGRLSAELSVDGLHLSDAGYRVLAQWIVADGGAAGRLLAP
jgi:lysophospholipase L1-like esterase